MVLEVEANTWQVNQRLDAGLAELLRVTNARALKDEWRAQRSTRNDNLLAGANDPGGYLGVGKMLSGNHLDTNGPIALKDDLIDLIAG